MPSTRRSPELEDEPGNQERDQEDPDEKWERKGPGAAKPLDKRWFLLQLFDYGSNLLIVEGELAGLNLTTGGLEFPGLLIMISEKH